MQWRFKNSLGVVGFRNEKSSLLKYSSKHIIFLTLMFRNCFCKSNKKKFPNRFFIFSNKTLEQGLWKEFIDILEERGFFFLKKHWKLLGFSVFPSENLSSFHSWKQFGSCTWINDCFKVKCSLKKLEIAWKVIRVRNSYDKIYFKKRKNKIKICYWK